MTVSTDTVDREELLVELTDLVKHFDFTNRIHLDHWFLLSKEFGETAAMMLVSQDAAWSAAGGIQPHEVGYMELTDPGEIASWAGWKARNRVVRHGETAKYVIFDAKADTKVGGRVVKMFTRDQTVPAYAQPE
jgi:hypothetical protein